MARIKAAKIVPCQTREEFEETVDSVARMAVEKEKLVAALKKRHQDLDDKYGAGIKEIERDIQASYDRAAPYFEEHAGELCDKDRRSGSTKLARFGVRLGQPTVTKIGKFRKVAWKALGLIFDGIEELRQFVRNQPEVDKEKILKVFSDLKSKDQNVVSEARAKKAVLDQHGISMEQTDEFWVEPIADEQVS